MSCGISGTDKAVKAVATDSALCGPDLRYAVDTLADTILDYSTSTPPPVIRATVPVIKGYDAGCSK